MVVDVEVVAEAVDDVFSGGLPEAAAVVSQVCSPTRSVSTRALFDYVCQKI